MAEAVAFYILAALILVFGVLVITAKNTVYSVLFLVMNFLFVAARTSCCRPSSWR